MTRTDRDTARDVRRLTGLRPYADPEAAVRRAAAAAAAFAGGGVIAV